MPNANIPNVGGPNAGILGGALDFWSFWLPLARAATIEVMREDYWILEAFWNKYDTFLKKRSFFNQKRRRRQDI